MESRIIWKSGSPIHYGKYLIVLEDGYIDTDEWTDCGWNIYDKEVLYWIYINNIEITKK